jgi:helix-turn-helix protein
MHSRTSEPSGSLLIEMGYMSEDNAARAVGLKTSTLRAYRKAKTGPRHTVIARRILYLRADLESWLRAGGLKSGDDE